MATTKKFKVNIVITAENSKSKNKKGFVGIKMKLFVVSLKITVKLIKIARTVNS